MLWVVLILILIVMKKSLEYTGKQTLYVWPDGFVATINPYLEQTSYDVAQVLTSDEESKNIQEYSSLLPDWVSQVEYIDAMDKEEQVALHYDQTKKLAIDTSTGLVTDPSWLVNDNA